MVFKIIIVGEMGKKYIKKLIYLGVGKSCLLNRYTKDEFLDEYNATIGVEFSSKMIKVQK